jgi:D-alanyl-D-alanine dipeptidase
MKRSVLARVAGLFLCAALAVPLTACGSSRYEAGYQAGYAAAKAEAAPAASEETVGPAQSAEDTAPEPALDSSGFVMLTEAVPDAILEIRYYTTYNFVGARIPGYTAPVALITREAADALKAVSDDLAEQGYRLKIYDAYRPQQAVDAFAAWAADQEDTRMKPYFYPQVEKSALLDQGYIASRSGHSRGSTLDLTLMDMSTGQEVDMGGPFDYFGTLSHAAYTATLTQSQIDHRALLRDAMTAHGFRGISTEWWHFTLVDEPYPDTYFDFPVATLE